MSVSNSLTKRENSGKMTFSQFISYDKVQNNLSAMIQDKNKRQLFITQIISSVSNNPKLAECDYPTIISAALLGNSLNLTPSPQLGQFYIVPFKDKRNNRVVATFQLGYKGYIQLAIRSGYYTKLNVIAIKEGELVRYDPLTEDLEINLIEDDEKREASETTGYYAFFEYSNGFRKAMYWSKKKMLSHADKYSQAFSLASYKKLLSGNIPASEQWKYSSFWYKDFDQMAIKTMLRQLISKWGVMSIEMQRAYEMDESVVNDDLNSGQFIDAEEEPVIEVTNEVEPEPEQETVKEEDPFEPELDLKGKGKK
jgi:recombination protein RecT